MQETETRRQTMQAGSGKQAGRQWKAVPGWLAGRQWQPGRQAGSRQAGRQAAGWQDGRLADGQTGGRHAGICSSDAMAACGPEHTCFLSSHGTVIAYGRNCRGQCDIPALAEGVTYTQVSAGSEHTVFLRSDGTATSCGSSLEDQRDFDLLPSMCDSPPLGAQMATLPLHDVKWAQVSAGAYHTRLLRSDGWVVACGENAVGQCDVTYNFGSRSRFGFGAEYRVRACSQISAGYAHSVLLYQNGDACAVGNNAYGQCDLPKLPNRKVRFVQVSAGKCHTVLLRSNGTLGACGRNTEGQCDFSALGEDAAYTEVAAGGFHTVLLRSDGGARALGNNAHGQCTIPALKDGVLYTHVCAGEAHTVLLRSDGTAASCGRWLNGRWTVPVPVRVPTGMQFQEMQPRPKDRVVQLFIDCDGRFVIRDLAGLELMSWTYPHPPLCRTMKPLYYDSCSVQDYVATCLRRQPQWRTTQALRIVLPDGRELWHGVRFSELSRELLGAEPSASAMVAAGAAESAESAESVESAEHPAAVWALSCSASVLQHCFVRHFASHKLA